MRWYLIHTKPRQEKTALWHLEQQGYECYLPMLRAERLRRHKLVVVDVPLFSRYLFIRLGQGGKGKSWAPIRSTIGVSRLVHFGEHLAQVDDRLIEALKSREKSFHCEPERLFKSGDTVRIIDGLFSGLEAVYQMSDGAQRSHVLIDMLSKSVPLQLDSGSLRKAE
ncbi:MAG: transcription/translation regulatory transformer protein RfaH [Betaproteobacteria bacterium]|nr:transcription/translation regulatory transformer protein RfaH [Betaproteobacteria bacterium]